jgi:hypothetical protein
MLPSDIKIGKEQFSVLACADDIVLIAKNEIEIGQIHAEIENTGRNFQVQMNQGKTKYVIVECKNS